MHYHASSFMGNDRYLFPLPIKRFDSTVNVKVCFSCESVEFNARDINEPYLWLQTNEYPLGIVYHEIGPTVDCWTRLDDPKLLHIQNLYYFLVNLMKKDFRP